MNYRVLFSLSVLGLAFVGCQARSVKPVALAPAQSPSEETSVEESDTSDDERDSESDLPSIELRPASVEYTSDSLEDIARMVTEGKATLLDVRSQEEWDEGHVSVAKFLPSTTVSDSSKSNEVTEFLSTLESDKPVYVHCFRGGRALRCAKAMAASGLDLRPIQAKFEDFESAGFEIVK